MSSQKGNTSRTRAQKYKNTRVFKNDLYDKTPQNKFINSLNISNVCERCKNILEWKIKYKKYKKLTAPKKCTSCEQIRSIKHAYHILCHECASTAQVCPACGKKKEIVDAVLPQEEQLKLDTELQQMVKALPERKRRSFFRYIANKKKAATKEDLVSKEDCKSDLLAKLESLKVQNDSDYKEDFDDDFDGDSNYDCSDDD